MTKCSTNEKCSNLGKPDNSMCPENESCATVVVFDEASRRKVGDEKCLLTQYCDNEVDESNSSSSKFTYGENTTLIKLKCEKKKKFNVKKLKKVRKTMT